MRSTKQAILTSAFISIISFMIYTILQFKLIPIPLLVYIRKVLVGYPISDIKEYLIVIFSGIFTGSILSLIIYIKEYQTIKTECLRNYLNAIIEEIKPFYNLIPFIAAEPLELIKDYYNELSNNEYHEGINRQNLEFLLKEQSDDYLESYKKAYMPLENDAKAALSDWIWENTKDRIKSIYQSPHQINKYIDEELNSIIDKYDSLIV